MSKSNLSTTDRRLVMAVSLGLAAAIGLGAFTGSPYPPALLAVVLVAAWMHPLLRRLEKRERDVRTIVDHAPALVGYIDAAQRFVFVNATYRGWLNTDSVNITGCRVKEVLGAAAYEALQPHLERALSGWQTGFEARLVLGGRARDVQGMYVPDIADGIVRGVFEHVTDITRLKERERELTRLAHYDPLTGAANVVAFNDYLCRALARARRTGSTTAVMYLELDRLKELQHQLGDKGSDELLREFAVRLKGSVRATDEVGRLGEEGFAVVLEGVSGSEEISEIARKVTRAIRAPMRLQGNWQLVTAGIGVATGAHDAAPDQLIDEARGRCRARAPLQALGIAA